MVGVPGRINHKDRQRTMCDVCDPTLQDTHARTDPTSGTYSCVLLFSTQDRTHASPRADERTTCSCTTTHTSVHSVSRIPMPPLHAENHTSQHYLYRLTQSRYLPRTTLHPSG